MSLFKSSNPAFKEDSFEKFESFDILENNTMTFEGALNKTAILLVALFVPALYIWNKFMETYDVNSIKMYMYGGLIVGLVLSFVIIFKKQYAPYLAPCYAVCQGLALGGISAMMETMFSGIVLQATILTFLILGILLAGFKFKIIKVTEKFRTIIIGATIAIGVYYLISFVAGFFGSQLPMIHDSGLLGIGFSVVVVVVAALNLLLDFDFIEKNAQNRAPKYMEWYAAFGLLVTLVWLYLEILRLLSKLQRD